MKSLLELDCGLRSPSAWVKNKFNIDLALDSVRELPADDFKKLVYEKAEAAYREKEVEYPVMVGLSHFTERDNTGHDSRSRSPRCSWSGRSSGLHVDLDHGRPQEPAAAIEIRATCLIEHSGRYRYHGGLDPQTVCWPNRGPGNRFSTAIRNRR